MDLLVDTSDELTNVREKYVSKIQKALLKNEKLHAPPILDFVWAEQVFRGVLVSLDISYLLFHIDGKPLRAMLGVKMKEYRPVKVQLRESENTSPDVEKRYVVRGRRDPQLHLRRGLPGPGASGASWRGPTASPTRALVPAGTVLTVPRLEEARR